MREWVEGLVGPEYALPTIVAAAAVIALFVLLLLWRLLRGGASGTYVAGGRNRKARLAVMDATAIDNYRRLVLVRRDDVEHLLLIGGSADVVVESNIRSTVSSARPVVQETVYDQPEDHPVAQPVPAPQPPAPPVMRPQPHRPAAPPPQAPRPQVPRTQAPARVDPPRPTYPPAANPATAPRNVAPTPAVRPADDAFDDDLLRELEVELDAGNPTPRNQSIEDEMSKILGDLSTNRR